MTPSVISVLKKFTRRELSAYQVPCIVQGHWYSPWPQIAKISHQTVWSRHILFLSFTCCKREANKRKIIKGLIRYGRRTSCIAPFCVYKIGKWLICVIINYIINLHKTVTWAKPESLLKQNKIQIILINLYFI